MSQPRGQWPGDDEPSRSQPVPPPPPPHQPASGQPGRGAPGHPPVHGPDADPGSPDDGYRASGGPRHGDTQQFPGHGPAQQWPQGQTQQWPQGQTQQWPQDPAQQWPQGRPPHTPGQDRTQQFPAPGYPPQHPESGYQPGRYPGPGQPVQGQPVQGQPGSWPQDGQWAPAPGGWQQPPPVDGKKRNWILIGSIAAAVLLVVVLGIVGIAALGGDGDDDKNTNTAAGTPTVRSSSTAPSAKPSEEKPAPTGRITLAAPAKIGALAKAGDQSRADELASQLKKAGIQNPYAAIYEDTAGDGRNVVVWGGTGALFQESVLQLDSFFSSAASQFPGATVGEKEEVDPGSMGGQARCASVDGGVTTTLCGWTGPQVLLGFVFTGYSPDNAAALLGQILPAVAVRQ